MRILQIHTHYRQPGGEDAVVTAEADLLAAGGHEVVEWRATNPSNRAGAAASLALSAWNPKSRGRLQPTLDSGPFDVAHVHNTWHATSPSILPAIAKLDIPIVMTLHNYRLTCANALLLRDGKPCELCVGSHPWHAVRYACYRDSRPESAFAAGTIAFNRRRRTWLDHIDRFLALTEFARITMIKAGLPEDRVIVKPNFVSDPGPRAGPPSASNRILFVGRLSAEKGVATLLGAWERARGDGLELAIVGSGPLEDRVRAAVGNGLTYPGRLPNAAVRQLMLESRALVFPSEWYEGMPITLLEAMAAGLPIMASELGSMTEMVRPLGDQWLSAPGSVEDWGRGIAAIASADVDAAGSTARSLWNDRYSPAVALEGLLAAYRF